MDTAKLIGTILIIASIFIGYIGINKIADSTKEINLLGLKIHASDESAKSQGYLYFGAAIFLFAGGVFMLKSKNS